MFEVVQSSVKVLNITQNKESWAYIRGAYNRRYFWFTGRWAYSRRGL